MTSFQMYTFTSKWVINANTKQMFLFGKLMLLLPQVEVEVVLFHSILLFRSVSCLSFINSSEYHRQPNKFIVLKGLYRLQII